MNIVTVTFDQFNVSLLNKSVDFLNKLIKKKMTNPKHLNGSIIIKRINNKYK